MLPNFNTHFNLRNASSLSSKYNLDVGQCSCVVYTWYTIEFDKREIMKKFSDLLQLNGQRNNYKIYPYFRVFIKNQSDAVIFTKILRKYFYPHI